MTKDVVYDKLLKSFKKYFQERRADMRKRNLRLITSLFFLISSLIFFNNNSYAAFNLSVVSSEGGTDIHFPKIASGDFKQNMQMTLTVDSTIGKQYRIVQQVIKPLTTMEGVELPPEQFKMYPLVNSNAKGTLIYRQEMPVERFDTALYTSDPAGSDDSFQLVYSLEPRERQTAGRYYGTLAYVLEPINSTESQMVVTFNVYAELGAGAVPTVDIQTNSGSSRLVLASEDIDREDQYDPGICPRIDIKISGPLEKKYSIYQNFEGGIVNSVSGQEFDLSKVAFLIDGGGKGTVIKEGDLKQATGDQLLYTSDLNGSAEELTITYKPAKGFRLLPAGLYRGRLSFMIESGDVKEKVQTIDFEFNIVKVFDIYVYSNGKEGVFLDFGKASFKDGIERSLMEVHVESNAGQPYQVIQKVDKAMMNEKGDQLAPDDFIMLVRDIKTLQEPKFYMKEVVPVREGDTAIFFSGQGGESSSMVVEYQLKLGSDTKGGNYSAKIGYSLVQS